MKRKYIAIVGMLFLMPSAEAGFKWLPDAQMMPVAEVASKQAVSKVQPQKVKKSQKKQPIRTLSLKKTTAFKDLLAARAGQGGVVYGFGDQVPLVIALRQIVPTELEFSYGPTVNLSALVTWRGGKSWQSLLDGLLRPLDLTAYKKGGIIHVSSVYAGGQPTKAALVSMSARPMELQEVEVPSFDSPLDTGGAVFEEEMAHILDKGREPVRTAPTVKVSKPLPVLEAVSVASVTTLETGDVWIVERGRTLQEVLQEWSNRAGWVVVWNTNRDYLIESSAVFEGRFEMASADLVRAFAVAEPPVMATFYKNRTLVIESQNDGEAN